MNVLVSDETISQKSKIIMRISIALLFLWFGVSQLHSPSSWTGFLPDWTNSLSMSPSILIYLNGSLEITFGLFLISGLFTRISSLILGLHLLGIALSMPYSPTMIRDLVLSVVTIIVFFNGSDDLTLDKKLQK